MTKILYQKKNLYWKKPHWQKFLIGAKLKNKNIKNACYLDTDIIINPQSPDIFKNYKQNKILASSNIYKLPYDLKMAQKKVVFFRKNYLNRNYPLDSAMFANLKQTYSYSNLSVQKDSLCAGLFIFNIKNYSDFFEKIFFKYKKNYKSLTGGDQVHFSYYVLKYQNVELLDYKFQAYWLYEMALNYPFLYYMNNKKIIKECILACLMNNYFLHFPGKWKEGQMWKVKIFEKKNLNYYKKLFNYYKKKVYGNPVGFISEK